VPELSDEPVPPESGDGNVKVAKRIVEAMLRRTLMMVRDRESGHCRCPMLPLGKTLEIESLVP
jgi:hypothetical protein